jgi:hypothetical protein
VHQPLHRNRYEDAIAKLSELAIPNNIPCREREK